MALVEKQGQLIDVLILSNFVHQVINPLNGVIGTLDNLLDGTIPQTKQKMRLKEVRAQLEHAIDLIRNLAYLSTLPMHADAGTIPEKKQPCVIPQIVIEGLLYYQEVGNRREIRIELSDPKTQFVVQGYPALLRQMFMNMFENGIKYSDPGSRITVTPREQKKTGQLLIEVESKGPGFDNSEREKIFELGYRGRRTSGITASGSGLGLYITRRIVELHGGTIEAEYAEDARRTVFRVRLPTFQIGGEWRDVV